MRRLFVVLLIAFLCSEAGLNAQIVAVKTNALYLATSTLNAGVEVALGDRFSVDLEGGYNPWTLDWGKNMKARHYLVSPEIRYWFCESFNGHFIGINANYTLFNVGGVDVPAVFFPSESSAFVLERMKEFRNEGWAAGAGLTCGCQWIIAKRWNLELTAGFGYWVTSYNSYEIRKCGLFRGHVEQGAFGPTALSLSFIYIIR